MGRGNKGRKKSNIHNYYWSLRYVWDLDGWEGDARGRGYGDICIHIAGSLFYTAETNTTL